MIGKKTRNEVERRSMPIAIDGHAVKHTSKVSPQNFLLAFLMFFI